MGLGFSHYANLRVFVFLRGVFLRNDGGRYCLLSDDATDVWDGASPQSRGIDGEVGEGVVPDVVCGGVAGGDGARGGAAALVWVHGGAAAV